MVERDSVQYRRYKVTVRASLAILVFSLVIEELRSLRTYYMVERYCVQYRRYLLSGSALLVILIFSSQEVGTRELRSLRICYVVGESHWISCNYREG